MRVLIQINSVKFLPDCTGSEAFLEHRQVVDKDHDARSRDHERGAVLRGRRHTWSTAAPPAGATGAMSEVTHRVGSTHESCGRLMDSAHVRQSEGSGFKSRSGQIAYFRGVKPGSQL